MKLKHKTGISFWTHVIPFTFAISLTACDSGKELSPSSKAVETGPTTGILMDAIVSGVSYTTSSGKEGITTDQGIFNYEHGDTVEFKIGELSLGNIKATPIVTPIELAEGNDNKLQNLLVLLQSLDSDGDPSNGITISAESAAAFEGSINLESDPNAFVNSSELQAAIEAGGINNAKTIEEANTHFLSQSVNFISSHIWVKYDENSANVLRVATDGSGEYLHGQASPDDSCDENRVCGGRTIIKAGVEYGVINALEFDTRGFKLVGEPSIDTNLKAGLSDPGPTRRVHTDGRDLITSDIVTVQREREKSSVFGELFHIASPIELSDENEPILKDVKETRLAKMDNNPSGIVGAWVLNPDTVKTQTFLFFSNKKFMMIDPLGDTQRADQANCGKPGVEYASYDYNSSSEALTISGYSYDTNGCAGFSETNNEPHSFSINADGDTAILAKQGEDPVTLYRVLR